MPVRAMGARRRGKAVPRTTATHTEMVCGASAVECGGRDIGTSDAHGHANIRTHTYTQTQTQTHTDTGTDTHTDIDTDRHTHNRKLRRACQPRPQSHTPHTKPQLGCSACGSLLSPPSPAPNPPPARPPPVARHYYAQLHWPAQIYTDSRRGGSRASLFHPKTIKN